MQSLTLVLLALSSLASAQITLDLGHSFQSAKALKRVNKSTNSTLAARDTARVAALTSGLAPSATAINVFSSYTLDVTIGSANRSYGLIVDTGASTLWAGAHDYRQFRPSNSTVKQTQQPFAESYGSGWMDGVYYKDTVTIGGVTAKSQSLGGANDSEGFCRDCHGSASASNARLTPSVIGFGPTALTSNIVPRVKTLPTIIDTLYAQKQIPKRMVGIDFRPTTSIGRQARSNGVITLGGYNSKRLASKMTWMPHIQGKISSDYWNAAIDSIVYTSRSKKTVQLTTAPARRVGVIDSGTTLVLLPADAYGEYIHQAGGTIDKLGFVRISQKNVAKLGNVTISMGGSKFVLTPSAQLFPPIVAAQFGVNGTDAVSIFGSTGHVVSGLDFILGQMFLERFYAAFDSATHRVGLAYTPDTFKITTGAAATTPAKTGNAGTTTGSSAKLSAAQAKHAHKRRSDHRLIK